MNAHPYLVRRNGKEFYGNAVVVFVSFTFLTTNPRRRIDVIIMEMNEHQSEVSDGKLKVVIKDI
jgi:hypothetical protein